MIKYASRNKLALIAICMVFIAAVAAVAVSAATNSGNDTYSIDTQKPQAETVVDLDSSEEIDTAQGDKVQDEESTETEARSQSSQSEGQAPTRRTATSQAADKVSNPGGSSDDKVSQQPKTVSFRKGGFGIEPNDKVHISALMSEASTGTCTYRFYLSGALQVEKLSYTNNSNRCEIYIPVSDFPAYATYSFTIGYASNDGMITASQAPDNIDIHEYTP